MHSGRESTEFAAYLQGAATGIGEENAVSEMSALTNELDGEGKAGKRDIA